MSASTTDNGTRLRCDVCNAEFIVIATAPADLKCCNQPPTVLTSARPST